MRDDCSLDLRYALNNDIIQVDVVRDIVEEMKKKEYLAMHKHKIFEMKGGVYATYLPTKDGKRLYRRRNSLEELEDVIAEHYKSIRFIRHIDDVFDEWIDEKLEYGEISKSSYDRYQDQFRQFFSDSVIAEIPFEEITDDDLERFIKSTIRDKRLTQKSYQGLRTLIRGMFKFGKHRRYTNISITSFFGDLDLRRNMFTKKLKRPEQEVFSEDEIPIVTQYLMDNPDIYNLGILLDFYAGIRVGELSTLKYSDITGDSIWVQRSEQKIKDENGKWSLVVSDHPKTDAGYREVMIPPKAVDIIEIIRQLNPEGEYLFMVNGKRIRGNTFNKRLGLVCEKLGLPHRSMHKIRKTYGTTLIDSNVDDAFIAQQMGHSDISTTRKIYYFSNKSRRTKGKQIREAINF